ncbi:hypothetical protein K3495_g9718 [Podosphaera aphanis]|nr:hypothetical protein K3495_g9718 [Podosphaera aphanis]
MVKFYETTFNYDYSFPAVTLAYFLRYPNPFSTHVLSTDVISREVNAQGRLHTVRLHQKRTRLPSAVLKFLPQSVLSSISGGRSDSYVLESSTIDIEEGWMRTESRNLDWTGILSVVEKQRYQRCKPGKNDGSEVDSNTTNVVTTVIFRSGLGDRFRTITTKTGEAATTEVDETKRGFFANWSTNGVQRSIEAIARHRTENQLGKSKEGMLVVLERMRSGGLKAVLEGMRRDREKAIPI